MQIDKNTTDRKTNSESSTLKPTRRTDSAPETERKAPAKAAKGEAAHRDGKKTADAPTAAEKPVEPSSIVERDSNGKPTDKEKPVKRRFPSMDAIKGKSQAKLVPPHASHAVELERSRAARPSV